MKLEGKWLPRAIKWFERMSCSRQTINRDLKIYDAIGNDASSKQNKFFLEDNIII